MVADIEVRGLDDLARLSRAMREAGEQGKGLRREVNRAVAKETKQVRANMRKAIVPALPKRGGLAADVLSSTRFTSGTTPSGVRIKVRGKRSIRRMNRTGTFRHPVFGRSDVWVNQFIPGLGRFLDRPFEASGPGLQYAVGQALARVRSQIERSV